MFFFDKYSADHISVESNKKWTRTQKGVPSHLKNVWVKYKRKTKTYEDKTDKRESGDWLHSAEAASRLMAFGGRVEVGAVGGRA